MGPPEMGGESGIEGLAWWLARASEREWERVTMIPMCFVEVKVMWERV